MVNRGSGARENGRNLEQSTLRRNAAWAVIADGVQLMTGLGTFFLLARSLGTEQFGEYAAIVAVATLAIPVCSFGASQLLMMDTERGVSFPTLWPTAVGTVLVGGLFASTLATFLVRPLLGSGLSAASFAALFASQAIGFALAEFALVSTRAHRNLWISVVLRIVSGSVRLCAVGVFVATGGDTTAEWAWFALLAWTIAAVCSLAIVSRVFAVRRRMSVPDFERMKRGLPYAVGAGSANALDAVDRPMLLRISGGTEAGIYAAGYRIVQMSLIPISALVKASEADFFEAGAHGSVGAFGLARRLSRTALAYGIPVGIAMFFLAPVVPALLGSEWEESVSVIRFLAFLPTIKALQIFAANALTGLGMQGQRNSALRIALGVNVASNLLLMPIFGWRGAAGSTLVAECLMAALMWRGVASAKSTGNSDKENL